ncbi:glutamate receptor ionotropic, NMDA 2B-like isoform X2 [Tachypleus tridentatus]|uniref:glutamate receptor ionotropic, NMDA 2B-like isoform X2 n=1 Tax=Tachypleus tridentatus TaxID=6853 RepID=UPI003FCF2484
MKVSVFLIYQTFLLYEVLTAFSSLQMVQSAKNSSKFQVTFGVIFPQTLLLTVTRSYDKKLRESVEAFTLSKYIKYKFKNSYEITSPPRADLSLNPSPTDILKILCNSVVKENTIAILYFTNSEIYGSNTASVQYLLQLTAYMGIPVIAWNADNIGVQQHVSGSRILQLAPSMEHQAAAILSILRRYLWHQFSIVTTLIGGHDDFVRAVRDLVLESTEFTFNILDIFVLKGKTREEIRTELELLKNSDTRVILLYVTKEEGVDVMGAANDLGITGKNYIWIATQLSVGSGTVHTAPSEFPLGMLAIHFNASTNKLEDEIERAVSIFFHGLELFVNDHHNHNEILSHNLQCNGSGDTSWNRGDLFFRYLRNVSVQTRQGQSNIHFNSDGTLKDVQLEVLNLNRRNVWEKVGFWSENELEIKDIVWPGDSPVPPPGVPEKFNLKITFMEEPPYLNIFPMDNETRECKASRSVRCRVVPESKLVGVNMSEAIQDPKYYKCCSGFCIDLLQNFAADLGFTYDLFRVTDGNWGVLDNGSWNGLIAEILLGKADVVVTSIKINSERQTAVDFTVPFLETGITIAVAKRTGIISPKAFLEPFDTVSWLLILLVSIQLAAFFIFVFEWMSPSGYDMKGVPPRDYKFSLFRTYWLVWAILFGASVNVDCPRGYTAKFMSSVWAMFAVVFLALYTANLAAFMITREEFYDLSGIEDKRLKNPWLTDPPFRFGTIPHGNTEAVLEDNKPKMHRYMKNFNRSSVTEGVKAVKKGELDAFIYDATVLEYLAGQDNECRLLTVGSWYATTGYGFALPKKSKYLSMFNKWMIHYRENGELERLQRFWLQGACKPTKNKRNATNPLDINQFMSAFLLLGCGVIFTVVLLGMEHLYFRYIRKHLAKTDTGGCFALVSLSMGKSLSFRGAVFEAQDMLKHHRCRDPVCDTQLWKVRHELDMARLKLRQLEKKLNKESSSDEFLVPKSMSRSHICISQPYLLPSSHSYYCRRYYGSLGNTEITELETVL